MASRVGAGPQGQEAGVFFASRTTLASVGLAVLDSALDPRAAGPLPVGVRFGVPGRSPGFVRVTPGASLWNVILRSEPRIQSCDRRPIRQNWTSFFRPNRCPRSGFHTSARCGSPRVWVPCDCATALAAGGSAMTGLTASTAQVPWLAGGLARPALHHPISAREGFVW